MSFLAPYMLWGTLAAGIPIALHFFYRSRHRTVHWGAMKFLLAAIEQTSRRLRFQELLLLLLRCAVLVLLALALSRPASSTAGRAGRGDAVDAVMIVDTSMSMGARAGVAPLARDRDVYTTALRQLAREDLGVTCFDRARAAAMAVLAALPPQSTVQVVASSDRAGVLGPLTPAHLDQARTILEGMTLTDLGTDYLPAVRLAVDVLERGQSPNKELYLFSDMQRAGFEARGSALVEALADLRQKASVHLVHCGPSRIANVALAGITPQSSIRTGERAEFAVLVRNTGKVPVKNLTVTLEADSDATGRDSQPITEVLPGETRAVVLSLVLAKPGRHVLSASVRADDLDGDNRLDQVIHVADRVGVLVVDGAPDSQDPRRSASYYVQHALNPTADERGFPVTVVSAYRASPRDLGGKELCLVVNARLEAPGKEEAGSLSPEFVRALGGFVQEGKPLVFFAGNRADPESYNRVLFDQLRLIPYRIAKVENAPPDRPFTLDRRSAEDLPFRRFRDEQGYAGIDRIEVRRLLALETEGAEARGLADESRVLLRMTGGRAAVASRRRAGQGEVLLFTTSMNDPAWSDWYVVPSFVPFIQVTLSHLLESRPQALNRVVGEPIVWQIPPADAEAAFDLVLPDGQRRRLGAAEATRGRSLLTATDVTRAGLYRILPAGREVTDDAPLFAVAPDLRETEDLEYLAPGQIDTRLGFTPFHLTAGEDGGAFSGAERMKREWTPWLLGALLFLVLGEMGFAWYCGRSW